MSSNASARFALKMSQGAYHRGLFREERNTHETIVTRDGVTSSTGSNRAALRTSIGDLLTAKLATKK